MSLIGLFVCIHQIKTDRVTTFREFKVVETPSASDDNPDANHSSDKSHMDLSFFVDADEHLEKLKSQAEELRDTYNELIKNAFGHELQIKRTETITLATNQTTIEEDSAEMVGKARKVSADWVRAAINPMLLNNNSSKNNSSETLTKDEIKSN